MDIDRVVDVFAGAVFGGAVNWFFAWRGAKALEHQTGKLRHMVNTLARAQATGQPVAFIPDDGGDINALSHERVVGGNQPAPSGELTAENRTRKDT